MLRRLRTLHHVETADSSTSTKAVNVLPDSRRGSARTAETSKSPILNICTTTPIPARELHIDDADPHSSTTIPAQCVFFMGGFGPTAPPGKLWYFVHVFVYSHEFVLARVCARASVERVHAHASSVLVQARSCPCRCCPCARASVLTHVRLCKCDRASRLVVRSCKCALQARSCKFARASALVVLGWLFRPKNPSQCTQEKRRRTKQLR